MEEEDYTRIFKEYQELKEKTKMISHNMDGGEKINPKYICPTDVLRLDELKKVISDNLSRLTNEQLIELRSDNYFSFEVIKVLSESSKNK